MQELLQPWCLSHWYLPLVLCVSSLSDVTIFHNPVFLCVFIVYVCLQTWRRYQMSLINVSWKLGSSDLSLNFILDLLWRCMWSKTHVSRGKILFFGKMIKLPNYRLWNCVSDRNEFRWNQWNHVSDRNEFHWSNCFKNISSVKVARGWNHSHLF